MPDKGECEGTKLEISLGVLKLRDASDSSLFLLEHKSQDTFLNINEVLQKYFKVFLFG